MFEIGNIVICRGGGEYVYVIEINDLFVEGDADGLDF